MEKRQFRDFSFNIFRSSSESPIQLIIFHGICEHSFRYIPFIKKLNEIGFDCTLIDHPGHGQQVLSELFNEELFEFYNSIEKDFSISLEKAEKLISHKKSLAFQKKFLSINKRLNLKNIIEFQKEFCSFLFKEKIYSRNQATMIMGQSLGGLIASVIGNEMNDLSGAIFLSPAFKAIPKPLISGSATDRIRHKIESTIISKSDESFSKKSFFNSVVLNPLLGINPTNDSSWACDYISDIGEVNELFSRDPLIGSKLSLKFLQSIQKHMKTQREITEEYPCSVFIEFGSDDKIVSAEGSREFIANRLQGHNHFHKQLESYQPHEIHNSKRRNYLLSDIKEWAKGLS